MDAVNDPSVREIVVVKSAQIGWTEILGNVVGYYVHRDPSPILIIQPTLEMGEAWSKDRLAPMVRDSPALKDKIKDARARDSGNTLLHKQFAGGHITIAGANSPAGLASRPIRIVLCDEVDRYPSSAGAEGDPISLARKRSTTFWNRKLLLGSTPTVKGASRIEAAFESSDQRHFLVPCPHCGEFDRLKWDSVKWSDGAPRSAWYACPHCGSVIRSADKLKMLSLGKWVATAPFDGVAGFHVNELYSPWVDFGDTAAAFVEAKKSPQTLQTWVNTALGETWVDKGDAPKVEAVDSQICDYRMSDVPEGVLAITCGVDVQKTRLIYVVRGWGVGMESWLLRFGELPGDPQSLSVWSDLSELLADDYDGRSIDLALVDSGFLAAQVYDFCRRTVNAKPSKGSDSLSAPIKMARIDVSRRGKFVGQDLWHIDANYFKTVVHGRISWPQDQPGAWHLPADVPDDYKRQIVAESKIILPNGRTVWKRIDRENHALDCEVYATAAAKIIGADRIRRGKIDATQTDAPETQEAPASVMRAKPLPTRRMQRAPARTW